jgi:hypothetical protein
MRKEPILSCEEDLQLRFFTKKHLRRRPESNAVFSGCQPQYPDLQGDFNTDFKWVQALFGTTRHLPALTRHIPGACSVIEEIVEGFLKVSLKVFLDFVKMLSLSAMPFSSKKFTAARAFKRVKA